MSEWRAIVEMADGLSERDREQLSHAIDDLVVDTTGTSRAVLTLKTILPKVGKDAYSAARDILVSVATAKAKQELGL